MIFNILVSAIPVALCIWLIRRYWLSRREEKKKSKEQKREEQITANIQQARGVGAIFILASVGLFAFTRPDDPWQVRAILFIFGTGLLIAAYYDEKKQKTRKGQRTDFIVSERGEVRPTE